VAGQQLAQLGHARRHEIRAPQPVEPLHAQHREADVDGGIRRVGFRPRPLDARDEVLAFYDAWYQPANCTMVVCGDVDPADAAAKIIEHFAPIPAKRLPEPFVPEEPPQEGERRFELEMEVQLPRLLAAFHTVRAADPRDTAFDVLQCVLAAGKSSRLHERLVRRDRLAASVGAWNDARRDPGLFVVSMEVQEGVAPARAEAVLWEKPP